MKYFGLVLSFLLVFGAANGFCEAGLSDIALKNLIKEAVDEALEDHDRQGPVQTRFIPLTEEIASKLSPEEIGTFYLPGELRLMKKSELAAKNGRVKTVEGNIEVITINAKTKGKFVSDPEDKSIKSDPGYGKEFFQVSFPENNGTTLDFFLNKQNDRFELKNSIYDFAGPVYLYIEFEDKNTNSTIPNRNFEVQKIEVQRIQITGVNVLTQIGQLREDDIVAFIYSKNPAMSRGTIKNIVSTYIMIARSENINHDIAIAQMCFATNFLTSQQRFYDKNYGGLLDANSMNARFPDMATGIRAHIQHLKGYASTVAPKAPIVDSRYEVLRRMGILGTVTTLEGLCARWVPLSDYGVKINAILRDMNYYSAVARR